MAPVERDTGSRSVRFWILAGYLGLVLLLGGGARSDIQSLAFLRPAAVLLCGFALITLRREQVREHRFLFAFAALLFLLPILHLIPLPSAFWSALPGRAIIVEIDQLTGLGDPWRPLSMAPATTWNALYSLFVPLAALLIGVQLTAAERRALLPVIIVLGMASGLMGLLQVIGPPRGALYLYRVTNEGAAVGFFANRNHQAVFLACVFPMLAVFASGSARSADGDRLKTLLMVAGGLILVPLLLVTGSRAGLITGVLGLLAGGLLYRNPASGSGRPGRRAWPLIIAAGSALGVFALAAATILLGRAEALDRITGVDSLEDDRFRVWGPILDMAWSYFPFGSGIGTFVETYKLDEPDALLDATFLNHAHNDWLEVLLTGGLAGTALLLVAVVAWGVASLRAWRPGSADGRTSFARLASIVVLILGLASVSDYPLRVPFLACLATVAALWLRDGATQRWTRKIDSPPNAPLPDAGLAR